MVVYYSGTGNSRYVAEALADMTGDELLAAAPMIRSGGETALSSEKPWIFVGPVYGWQLAHIFTKWIAETKLCGAKEAYFLLTCGGDMGNSGAYLEKLCKKKALIFCGAQEIVMPENYIAMFKAPGPKASAKIRKAAFPKIEEAARKILAGENFPSREVKMADRVKSSLVNAAFYKFFVKSKDFYAKENCIGCGKCAENCPVNGIEMREGKPVWTGKCTHCMACICGCEVSAVEYGKKSGRKVRYQCPHYGEE